MCPRVRELLEQRSADGFVGRGAQLSTLFEVLDAGGPLLLHVHGIAGIGKTALLNAFAARARGVRALVVRLDCRSVEPTAAGFLQALSAAIGSEQPTLEAVGRRLERLGRTVVVALDNFELLRLLDTWLRQDFVPALHDNVRLLLVGRQPPSPAWRSSPGWTGLFRSLALGPLDDAETGALLASLRVAPDAARRIAGFAQGHPLALVLASVAAADRPDVDLDAAALPQVVDALTRVFLADVDDPVTREALDAAAVVRRLTLPLLRAMMPAAAPQDALDALAALPFVEPGGDGLVLHEAVKHAIAERLRSSDPSRHRALRLAAWRVLRGGARGAHDKALWRWVADVLYLLENPVVREAFFPTGVQQYAVEPARPDDGEAILSTVRRHEGPAGWQALAAWWRALPACFHVVRTARGTVTGFYLLADAAIVPGALSDADPALRAWQELFAADPPPPGQRVLYLRRWLSEEHGELPSPVQAACWIDVKRHYMELRPTLRRIALSLCNPMPYASVAQTLGFAMVPTATVELDGTARHTAVLDFGPHSVEGWLAGLLSAELGADEGWRLDAEGRELVLEDRRVSLTPREFAVLAYLNERRGRAVSRDELLDEVWEAGQQVGSNVVDVTMRALRSKLGDEADLLQTVHRVGYRLRP